MRTKRQELQRQIASAKANQSPGSGTAILEHRIVFANVQFSLRRDSCPVNRSERNSIAASAGFKEARELSALMLFFIGRCPVLRCG